MSQHVADNMSQDRLSALGVLSIEQDIGKSGDGERDNTICWGQSTQGQILVCLPARHKYFFSFLVFIIIILVIF